MLIHGPLFGGLLLGVVCPYAPNSVILVFNRVHSICFLSPKLENQLGLFFPRGMTNVCGSKPISSGMLPERKACWSCCWREEASEGWDCFRIEGAIALPI